MPGSLASRWELVAELSAAFIGAQIGLPADHIEDHAAPAAPRAADF
jgi:hypothetical protein